MTNAGQKPGAQTSKIEVPRHENKEAVSGLAAIAIEILEKFFKDSGFQKYVENSKDALNRIYSGNGTEQDKASALLEIKNQKDLVAQGAYASAPSGVPSNYFAKLEKSIMEA